MKKLLIIIGGVLVTFVLFSYSLYRLGLYRSVLSHEAVSGAHVAQEKSETVDGWIGSVDAAARSITLSAGNQMVTFILDEETTITESGEVIQPAAIAVGQRATVKYEQRSGHKKARSIAIYPATTPQTF